MKKGFTLIELLVVIAIIAILAVEKARATEALSMLGSVRYAVERYRLQTTDWPAADFGVLDIEVPTSTTNFNYSMQASTDASKAKYIIAESKKSTPTYYLVVGVLADGSTLRSCGKAAPTTIDGTLRAATAFGSSGSEADGAKLCNAISSGKPGGF